MCFGLFDDVRVKVEIYIDIFSVAGSYDVPKIGVRYRSAEAFISNICAVVLKPFMWDKVESYLYGKNRSVIFQWRKRKEYMCWGKKKCFLGVNCCGTLWSAFPGLVSGPGISVTSDHNSGSFDRERHRDS